MAYKYPKRHETFEGQGRPKGSRTKNNELRDLIRDFSIDKFDEYMEAFEAIGDPKDKAKEYREMLKYVVPTITAVQFEQEGAVSNAQQHLRELTSYGGGEGLKAKGEGEAVDSGGERRKAKGEGEKETKTKKNTKKKK